MVVFLPARWLLLGVLAALALASCTPQTRVESSALLVKVSVTASSASKCVRVIVRPDDGPEASTSPIAAKSELQVAVYRAAGWSAGVTVLARGYASCDAAADLTAQIEESALVKATFPGAGTEVIALALTATPLDLDGDGHFAGPDDCNDGDAAIFKGAPELCNSTVDNNCSGTSGCADSSCTGVCGAAGSGVCVTGVCRTGVEDLCGDGADNDGDLQTDCADSDCLNDACDDSSACTSGERCNAAGACASTNQTSCSTSPGSCFTSAGTCNPLDGGCSYPVRIGSCDDQSVCTSTDVCLTDGGCAGATAVSCTTPPSQCHLAAGVCDAFDAGCSYLVRTGGCSDTNACTIGESCQGDGSCGAPTGAVSCGSPPSQCFVSPGSCNTVDGGCSYAPRPGGCDDGLACTTGEQCLGDGGCSPGTPTVCNSPPSQCYQTMGACDVVTGACAYGPRGGPCNDGNACTTGDSCTASVCMGTTSVSCNTPPGQCFNPTGACQPSDGGCAYSVQPGVCSDSNACTLGETCLTDGGCGAPTGNRTCPDPAQCFDAGVCIPADGGCSFAAAPSGNACSDSSLCTTNDTCNGSGVCTPGAAVSCTSTNICFDGGTCAPASGCPAPAPLVGRSCIDADNCTYGEMCDGTGSCVPTSTVTCTANECQTGGTCENDAGCAFNNRPNGFNCNSNNGDCFNGRCVTPKDFAYVPSNFAKDVTKALSELTIDCALTFNTDGANPAFTTCYPGVEAVTPVVITQSASALQAVVLHVAKLNVTAAGSLNVTGGRPLIIAVYGDATVDGLIDASAVLAVSGAGAGLNCPGGTPTNGSQNAGQGGSGAGGGGSSIPGANGGQGDGTTAVGTAGAINGSNPALTPLVGGCRGAQGGGSVGPGGVGGAGGGAVQVSASGALRVAGRLVSAGGGGAGGPTGSSFGRGGGGGGGAGGILLEGDSVILRAGARVTANGGGGGEGGPGNGTVGGAGSDGLPNVKTVAPGGTGTNGATGGNGGAGIIAPTVGGNAGSNFNGGGGGGGGYGRVRLNSPVSVCRESGHVVSPSGAANAEQPGSFTIAAPLSTTLPLCP